MGVEIGLLGGFEVRVGGARVPSEEWRRRNAAALVKLLALTPGRHLHRERVIDTLWPEVPVDDAAPRLHKAAHYARRALGDRSIVLTGAGVALCPDEDVTVDAADFQAVAEKALADETGSALARAAATRAADTYRGDLLPQDLYEPWTQEPRERLRLLHVGLLRAAQRWDDVLAADPADEEAHLALMRKYVAAGDRRGALRQFERMDRVLRKELGVGPSEEALALRASLLATDPGAGTATGPAAGSAGRGVERPRSTRRVPAPVGRDRELGGLDRLLSAGGTGRECTIFVSGVAGIGKSHLLAWLADRAAGRGWRTGSGVAAAVEGAWPYAPVLEAFADLCRRHPALLDGLRDQFREEIERALSGRELDWSGEGGHQRLFVAASELLRLAAAGVGVLLVVDDVHEADEASLRLLHYLARSGVGERVLLVLAHRPEPVPAALARVRDSLVCRSAALTLDLAPLDRTATAALLGRVAPSPRPEFVAEVWEASGGIPFRALELARHAVGPPSSREGTALLGGLPERTLDVLRAVAVAGATFDTDEFLALSGLAEPDAYAQLDAAIGARVLERTEKGYGFRHRLVRDALLSGLPARRERALHRGAAHRLDGLGASPARVGHHLLQAGDAAAAVPYVLRAAETEASVGAYRDALDLVDSVRGHAQGAERARLLALRADLLMAVGDGGAQAAYSAALAAIPAGEIEDTSRLLRARLSRAAVLAGDLETAAAAIEGIEADGGPADPAILLAQGHLAYARGNLDAASVAAREATRRVLTVEQDWQLLDLVGLQGLVAHNRGQWFQQMRLELQRVRNRPELAVAVFDSHLCVAEYLLYGPTPYQEVMTLARELQSTAERAGVLRAAAYATALLGEAALLAGDLDVAERELQEAAAVSHDIGSSAGEALSLQRLAEVRLAQGRPDEANRLLAQALPRARWSTLASHLIQRIYGTMITAAPDPEWARAVVDRAEATVNAADFCGFCNIMLAVPAAIACADAGDLDAAHRHLADAEESAALWEGTAWQAATLEARAHVCRGEGDDDAFRRLKAQAASLFEAAGQPLDAARCAG